MAATGSDPSVGAGAALRRRISLRLRLTLLYGACLLLGAAAVLAATYAVVAHETSSQTQQMHLPPSDMQAAQKASRGQVVNDRTGIHVLLSVALNGIFGPRYSTTQMRKVRSGALAMSRCMRAHGINYPNLTVSRGPDGHAFAVGFPKQRGPTRRARSSPTFEVANTNCSRLLDSAAPGGSDQTVPSLQKQLNAVVDWANAALATQRSGSLSTLLTWLGVALGVMAVISILLGWLLAGRAMRPLRTLTSRARRITEENLHERLTPDIGEDELGELANTFDGVLARLERAFDTQKRFVANASHELRTPLTLERALLELALASPDADAETLRRTCQRVLASAKHQQQMIEALLGLARSEGGTEVEAPVDLAEVTQDAIMLRERHLDAFTVATDLQPAPLKGDPALLERLIANLIDNAIVHNVDEHGWITIETGHVEGSSWLRVSNSGPEVPESMISEMFEPFRRIEGERTATATGLGLGLSIVKATADVHRAAIETRPLDGGGLRVEVRF